MSLLLAQANDTEMAPIGSQADKVFLILNTDDFWRLQCYAKQRWLLETPREEVYGTVAIFRDKFGNKWDLIQTT